MTTHDPRIAFFDRHAATWDADGPPVGQMIPRLEELRPVLGLQSGRDVLEVGCGTGQLTPWLVEAARPGRVTALDFSPAMLDKARARGTDAEFVCADVCSDDLGTSCFDTVFCMHVIPHLRDMAAALAHLARALKPGGRLAILHLDGRENINRMHDRVGGEIAGDHIPEPEVLTGLLEGLGLRVVTLIDEPDLFCLTAEL